MMGGRKLGPFVLVEFFEGLVFNTIIYDRCKAVTMIIIAAVKV